MAITHLKHGKPEADRAEDYAKTATVVAATLKDIEQRGDVAVRELANKFDGYDRDSYRLGQDEIDALIAKVSPRDLEDIKFAQAQVVNFAQAQRDSMLDIEVETMPGVILGHIFMTEDHAGHVFHFDIKHAVALCLRKVYNLCLGELDVIKVAWTDLSD